MAKIEFPAIARPYRQRLSALRTELLSLATYLEYQPDAVSEVQKQLEPFYEATGLTGGAGAASAVWVPPGLGFAAPLARFTAVEGGTRSPMLVTYEKTPEELFDEVSTARTAPVTTYYVGKGGLDSNDGLTWGARKLNISPAIIAGNATGQPFRVLVGTGEYNRTAAFQAVSPTQDCAIIAYRGAVVTGTFDDMVGFAIDATHTNCHSFTVGAVDRVCNRLALNDYGLNTDLTLYATAAALNAVAAGSLGPGGYAYEGGKLYIRRADGAVPHPTNSRFYRTSVKGFVLTQPVNLFLKGITFEGGQVGAVECTIPSTATASRIVATDCRFLYGGGNVNINGRSLCVDGIRGLAAFFDCEASAARTDGFNFHNTAGNAPEHLTVRCRAYDNGRGNSTSCNGITGHSGTKGVDIGSRFEGNRGGTVRMNTASMLLVGSYVANDLGDGSTVPTAVLADDNVTLWLDRVKIDMPANRTAISATGSGRVFTHAVTNINNSSIGGSGTIAEYTPGG